MITPLRFHCFILIIPFALFILIIPVRVAAEELTLGGGIDTFAFKPDETTPLGGSTFTPIYQPFANVGLGGNILSFAEYNINFSKDTVLQMLISADVTLNFKALRFGVGAFSGVSTSLGDLMPGFKFSAGLLFPGVFFIEGQMFGKVVDAIAGDNTRKGFGGTLGFWVPHVLISFYYNYKTYTGRAIADTAIELNMARLGASAHYHSKNIPFTIKVDAGMKTLSRSIETISSSAAADDAAPQVFVSLALDFRLARAFTWTLTGEGGLGIDGVAKGVYTFRAGTAFTFSLGK